MSIFKRNVLGVQAQRAQDDAAAQIARLQANQDYIAMMADIELEEEAEDEQ